ncbi:glycoside hydrolase [Pelomyxa schiedti]|nr:glycoside hydrolase [Pelomyxa schiedti]
MMGRGWLVFGVVLSLSVLFSDRGVGVSAANNGIKPSDIQYLYVVWSNHFDAGFTDYLIGVTDSYFQRFFPKAVRTVDELASLGGDAHYIWTCEAPWLLNFYLDENCENLLIPQDYGTLRCPTQAERDDVLRTIASGNITWGALPFTAEVELFDPSLLAEALEYNHRLDAISGHTSSIVLNQRDVPMLTRSAIPILNSKGIRAISIGVNGATPPAALSSPFVWRDPNSGGEVIVFIHPGGYGGFTLSDLVTVEGWPYALATVWKSDNDGPHSAADVIGIYKDIQFRYQNAEIITSTLDDFVIQLEKIKDQLPIVTSEVGDTWMYGVPSDPYKNAEFSTISRLRKQCVETGDPECSYDNPSFVNFNNLLLKSAEHTWGLDVKTNLHDETNWSNEQFEAVRNESNFVTMENSWREQRAYLDNAILSLGENSSLAQQIYDELEKLRPAIPDPLNNGYTSVPLTTSFACGDLVFQFDSTQGGLSLLNNIKTGHNWASTEKQVAAFVYQTFDNTDFDNYLNEYFYTQPPPSWAEKDFGKPGMDEANPQHATWYPSLLSLWQRSECEVMAEISFSDECHVYYGAPSTAWISIEPHTTSSSLSITLTMVEKTATRLAEAGFFQFNPNTNSGTWNLIKTGESVDPLDIAVNGSSHLHGIDTTADFGFQFTLADESGFFAVGSLDVPLVSVGVLDPFPTPLTPFTSVDNGISFNVFNNMWGTNYVQWFPFIDEDKTTAYRFVLYAS